MISHPWGYLLVWLVGTNLRPFQRPDYFWTSGRFSSTTDQSKTRPSDVFLASDPRHTGPLRLRVHVRRKQGGKTSVLVTPSFP